MCYRGENLKNIQTHMNIIFNAKREDMTEKWEELCERAKMLGIEWDKEEYDPVYLEQIIEDEESNLFRQNIENVSDYESNLL